MSTSPDVEGGITIPCRQSSRDRLPGKAYHRPMRLVAEFATADEYLVAHDQEISRGGMLLKGATLYGPTSM